MIIKDKVFTIENLSKVLGGKEDELILKEVDGKEKRIVYVNTESQDFLDNKVEFIENLLLQYQEDTGIEVAGYTVADYDDEEYQDLYDDTNELDEYDGCFDC